MARVTNNPLLQGISGKIGGLVVRQVGGQTVVQAAPAPTRRAASPAQQAQRTRMYQAQLYAKAQLCNPDSKARYAARTDQRRTSAYTVAIADFLHPPHLHALDARAYHGQPGDVLRLHATDDFAVASVHLRLLTPDGRLLEEGPATPDPTAPDHWRYVARHPNPTLPGTRLEAEARDYPGHVAHLLHTL